MRDFHERSTEDTYLRVLIGTSQRLECRNDDLRLVLEEFPILGLDGARNKIAARRAGTEQRR